MYTCTSIPIIAAYINAHHRSFVPLRRGLLLIASDQYPVVYTSKLAPRALSGDIIVYPAGLCVRSARQSCLISQ